MSERITTRRLVEILEGDEELVVRLCEEGIVSEVDESFAPDEVARVLVCQTLVRELDVSISDLDIVLRLREELLATRHQLAAAVRELERLRGERK